MKYKNLLLEALIIGLILSIISIAINGMISCHIDKMSSSSNNLALNAFISGSVFHIMADISGLNSNYCSSYPKEYL